MNGPSGSPPSADVTATTRADTAAPDHDRGRRVHLPSDLDPTVFDESFLRQLERLQVLMRAPVRGGLKGGRRSVKRGQSVEFADFRDYTLGDDLRQLDWNVLARLEKLFIKLYVEEEDVTISFLIDTSASMGSGRPSKLLFAQRAAAAPRASGAAPGGPVGGPGGGTGPCGVRGVSSGSSRRSPVSR